MKKAAMQRIFKAAKKTSILEILLYDQVGRDWWSDSGVTAKDVADQIKAAGPITGITLRINSPGGDVFEGAAIYSQLVGAGVPVDVIVDGLAASAASYIAMAGNTVKMNQGAMMMIHNPWAVTMGDSGAMRKMADTLDKVRDAMLTGYMRHFGGSQDDLKALLDAETWLTAADCVEQGLADSVIEPVDGQEDAGAAEAVAAAFDLSRFKNTPEALKIAADTVQTCTCPCDACVAGDCENCTTVDCSYAGCTCQDDSETEMAAKETPAVNVAQIDHYRRREHLAALDI